MVYVSTQNAFAATLANLDGGTEVRSMVLVFKCSRASEAVEPEICFFSGSQVSDSLGGLPTMPCGLSRRWEPAWECAARQRPSWMHACIPARFMVKPMPWSPAFDVTFRVSSRRVKKLFEVSAALLVPEEHNIVTKTSRTPTYEELLKETYLGLPVPACPYLGHAVTCNGLPRHVSVYVPEIAATPEAPERDLYGEYAAGIRYAFMYCIHWFGSL